MSAVAALSFGWGRRLPVVLQTEAAECGLACLAMIAGYNGSGVDVTTLRRRHGFSLKGATLKDLVRIADRMGFAARPVRLELSELPLLRTPAVLHFDMCHFVVLKSAGPRGIVVHDPADGVRRLSLEEASRRFTGVALELTPTGGFERAERPPRVRIAALTGKLRGLKRALAHLLVLALAIEILALLAPLFIGLTVDQAIVSADRALLGTLAAAFALLLLVQTAVSAVRSWLLMTLGASVKVQARTNLFAHLVGLPAGWYETRHVADVQSRFDSQETILQAVTTDIVVAVLDGLMCLVTLVVMVILAPGLALVVVAGAAFYAVLRAASYAPLRQASSEAIVWAARRDSHFLETLRGIRTIKLFNAARDRRATWLNLLVETMNRQLATQRLDILFRTANRLVVGGLTILVVYLAARSILAGTFSVGLMIAFLSYKALFIGRVSDLIDTAVELRMLGLHAERLADIALTVPEPPGEAAPARVPEAVSIEVRNLSFRYAPNDPWVLDDVSFSIAPGEWVAIAGASGGGKTTLLKLLTGLLAPTSGEILVNGTPLGRLGAETWRGMIGVVLQDDNLFAGSITDNITMFSPNPDSERIEEAARTAAVHEDIVRMPMGYASLIGDMGSSLSGGQKQRVLLARALYRDPSVLILDEATSHLDVDRERRINARLRRLALTRIAVAHRPETLKAADRVLTLAAARVDAEQREGADAAGLKRRAAPDHAAAVATADASGAAVVAT